MKLHGIETTILLADAKRGMRYTSFADFWTRRLADRQFFFPEDCQGPMKAVRDAVRKNARECWDQFAKAYPELVLPAASTPTSTPADGPADGCGGLPQAGGAHPLPATDPRSADPRSSEPLYE
jgi:hypothetical protein